MKTNSTKYDLFNQAISLEAIARELFNALPEGAKDIKVHIKMAKNISVDLGTVIVNKLSLPVSIEKPFSEPQPINEAEVWLEFVESIVDLRKIIL